MKGLHPQIADDLKDLSKITEQRLNEIWEWAVDEAKEWREFIETISQERRRREMEKRKGDALDCGVWNEAHKYMLDELADCTPEEYCLIDCYKGSRGYHSNIENWRGDYAVVMRDRRGTLVMASKSYKSLGGANGGFAALSTKVNKDLLKRMRTDDVHLWSNANCNFCLGKNGETVTMDEIWLKITCPRCSQSDSKQSAV